MDGSEAVEEGRVDGNVVVKVISLVDIKVEAAVEVKVKVGERDSFEETKLSLDGIPP